MDSAVNGRIIIHIDYDSFYASVVENERPELRGLPLGIQQKSILATCNYAARARGVKKLQSVSQAKKVCEDLIIVNGEDLTRFRDASKKLWLYIREMVWEHRTERLGFDEIFCDVTAMVNFNLVDAHAKDKSLSEGFFRLSSTDPTQGFHFSWNELPGHTFPPDRSLDIPNRSLLQLQDPEAMCHQRLFLACHLAYYVRQLVFEKFHYTASAGISTTKMTAKLVGSVNKPNKQTVLIPGFLQPFLDSHEIGKVPGVGFKIAQKLRDTIHGISQDTSLINTVTVEKARTVLDANKITKLFGSRQLGEKIYGWLHGLDPTAVVPAPLIPTQISIEDTFRSLDSASQLTQALKQLTTKLIQRMRIDLLSDQNTEDSAIDNQHPKLKWMAYPRNFRLSIRSQDAKQFSRISKSTTMPRYVFYTALLPEAIADKLVKEVVMPLFKKLHSSPNINIQLINVAAVNMSEETFGGDISRMFSKGSDAVIGGKDKGEAANDIGNAVGNIKDVYQIHAWASTKHSEAQSVTSNDGDAFESDGSESLEGNECDGDVLCPRCNALLPIFAVEAHARFHEFGDNRN